MPDESERYARIPARLEGRLMAFQREGVRFALRHGGRALIGDEMGLGKTVQVQPGLRSVPPQTPVKTLSMSAHHM